MKFWLPIILLVCSVASAHTTVDETSITLHTGEVIPRFAVEPDCIAVVDGLWSNPATWGGMPLPDCDDEATATNIENGVDPHEAHEGHDVSIPVGVTVTYDLNSQVRLGSIEVAGTLRFIATQPTWLCCDDITVLPGGTLQIGTEGEPIPPQMTAKITFNANRHPIEEDPAQFGNGLICLGDFIAHGADKTAFIRTGESPQGWTDGDRLVVPDTRQVPATITESYAFGPMFTSQAEELVYPNTAHSQADYAHIANLSRNIIIESQTPDDLLSRGHVMLAGMARCDLDSVAFFGLGRTSANYRTGLNGRATNPLGRYSLHLHHLMENGAECSINNCVIEDFMYWGAAVHHTDFSTWTDCVCYAGRGDSVTVYNGQSAACFATETGVEKENTFIRCFAMHTKAGTTQRIKSNPASNAGGAYLGQTSGRDGFWIDSCSSNLIDCVAVNCPDVGINLNGHNTTKGMTEYAIPGVWSGCEVYGCTGEGVWVSYPYGWRAGGSRLLYPDRVPGPITMSDFTVRNTTKAALLDYGQSTSMVYRNWLIECDPAVSAQSTGHERGWEDFWNVGVHFGTTYYKNVSVRIDGMQVTGCNIGIMMPHSTVETLSDEQRINVFSGLVLENHCNIEQHPARFGTVENVIEGAIMNTINAPDLAGRIPNQNVWMHFDQREPHTVLTKLTRINVNGEQLYYPEQAANYVIQPYRTGRAAIDPEAPGVGMTNAEALATLGICMCGEIDPSTIGQE